MAKLLLKFDNRVIDEYGLGLMVTIGRTPDNVLTIDNPAVSSHHACVFRDGNDYVLEDCESTNGTFVNEKRIARQTLQHNDVILVGKHTLVFDRDGVAPPVDADSDEPTLAGLRDTVYLDGKERRKLLARLAAGQGAASATADRKSLIASSGAEMPATLRVIAGRSDRSDYTLQGRTSMIGTAEAALVRLQGWFKPPVAAAISRLDGGYVLTSIRGTTRVNGSRLTGRRVLKDGDVLEVGGVTLEFRLPV